MLFVLIYNATEEKSIEKRGEGEGGTYIYSVLIFLVADGSVEVQCVQLLS